MFEGLFSNLILIYITVHCLGALYMLHRSTPRGLYADTLFAVFYPYYIYRYIKDES